MFKECLGVTVPGVVGFLGFGNMGQAIARGLVRAGAIEPSQVLAYDVDASKTNTATAMGGRVAESADELARESQTLLLAPKPQDMRGALQSLNGGLRLDGLVISIAAGVSIRFIQDALGVQTRVIRAMPNTPAMVGAGATAFARSKTCTEHDAQVARAIFEAIGVAEDVPEELLDAVTALSGSGPAYYFALVEAQTRAGVGLGLPEAQAGRLAGQTLYGAGLLLHESGESAATLRARVTSRGGTTAAALETFESRGFGEMVSAGMTAAAKRSRELGQ
jgi:pyrroline-5-carboxylate reductase